MAVSRLYSWAWGGAGRLWGMTTKGHWVTAVRFGYLGGDGAQPRRGRAGPAFRYQYGKGDELQQIVDEAACKVAGIGTGAYGRSLSRNGAAFTWSGQD